MRSLDASGVRRWLLRAAEDMDCQSAELNASNVFPVADGDTGTNMLTTLRGGLALVDALPTESSAGAVLSAMGAGALTAAAGNSGLILSQLMAGLAEGCPEEQEDLTSEALVYGLGAGARRAYQAVAAPVEGTILTVALAAAAAAADASPYDLAAVLRAARSASRQALAATPSQLPVLAVAGVLDTGAQGWCLVLEALAEVVGLEPMPAQLPASHTGDGVTEIHGQLLPQSFEVMFSLRSVKGDVFAKAEELRDALATIGDSIVVGEPSQGVDVLAVHVHTDDVGAAIELGMDFGRPQAIRVLALPDGPDYEPSIGKRVVIAGAPGPGLAALLASEGASIVDIVFGEPPAADAFLEAIEASDAREVIVLPGGRHAVEPAQQAAAMARELQPGLQVAVLPARSVVQSLAALAVKDHGVVFGTDVIAMTSAVSSTAWGSVTIAETDALTIAGMCKAGDVLGMLAGEVVAIGESLEDVAIEVLERLLRAGGEMVTIVTGAECPQGLDERLRVPILKAYPGIEWFAYAGGQARFPILLGVE